MVHSVVVATGLLLVSPAAETPVAATSDRAVYQDADAKAGRNAEAHLALALWCEARGLRSERARQLALAVLLDPANTTARGLMGLVQYGGQWRRPEAVSRQVRADEAVAASLAEYNRRRARIRRSADDHWALALWCDEHGLAPEARAHLTVVTRLNPKRDAAWKKLGYKKNGQRWVTDAQLAAEKAEADAQKRANKKWLPLLQKWHAAYFGKNETKRAEADAALWALDDPRAVPAVWQTFTKGSERSLLKAIEIFGAIDAESASQAIALIALQAPTPEFRRIAVETLRRRDAREYMNLIISRIFKPEPIRYRFKYVGVEGIGAPGYVIAELPDRIVRQTYTVDESIRADSFIRTINGYTGLAQGGFLVPAFAESLPSWTSAVHANAAPPTAMHVGNGTLPNAGTAQPFRPNPLVASADLGVIASYVGRVSTLNQRIDIAVASLDAANVWLGELAQQGQNAAAMLTQVTDQDYGVDQDAWLQWWANEQGYVYETPTVVEFVTEFKPVVDNWIHFSCFGAGTPVRTLEGSRPIESVRVGDRVLVEDPHDGRLSYQPVLAAFHNKPAATLRVKIENEDVVTTGIHRFWKAGHGWVMARDLKPGDVLRVLGGTGVVRSIAPAPVQPVFNLEVGAGQSFFVGAVGALVHDNSLVARETAPFDAPPELAANGSGGRSPDRHP